jgi:hypothetical protein
MTEPVIIGRATLLPPAETEQPDEPSTTKAVTAFTCLLAATIIAALAWGWRG